MSQRLSNEDAVERALAVLGRRAGEAMLRESVSTTIEVKDGAVDTVISRGERSLGVRVLRDGRIGLASTSDLTAAGIASCVEAADAMSGVVEADADVSLSSDPVPVVDLGIDESGAPPSVAERGALAVAVEREARAADQRVAGFRKTTCRDGSTETVFGTTLGARGAYRETSYGLSTSALAVSGGEKQIGWHAQATRRFADLDAAWVGRHAADWAVRKLGPRPFTTRSLPVLFDPWMGMSLLGALGPLFSAEAVLKGKSLFAGKVGARVASPLVTVVDDGRLAGGLRSAPFDGEGTPTSARTLIEAGSLRAYLTDRRSAKRMRIPSCGNARRGGPGGPPRVGTSNFMLAPGTSDPAAIAREGGTALRVTSLLNLHTINAISGEFSLGATGEILERGERRYPVEGITIAGNLTALLNAITAVGSDLTWGAGGHASPTFLVGELSVGGR